MHADHAAVAESREAEHPRRHIFESRRHREVLFHEAINLDRLRSIRVITRRTESVFAYVLDVLLGKKGSLTSARGSKGLHHFFSFDFFATSCAIFKS
jgi:hypothetical protein